MIDPEIQRGTERIDPGNDRTEIVSSPTGLIDPRVQQGVIDVMSEAGVPVSSYASSRGPWAQDGDPPTGAKEPRKGGDGAGTAVITRPKAQTKKPSMYRVLLLNDDYTPMEFVVIVLRKYFSKTADEATHIMLHVHHHGVGECGVFTYEVAETKVTQVMDFARKNQHPLQCIMEKK